MLAFLTFLIFRIASVSISVQGYNLMLGYTGIFSLGHVGFSAIGAYTTAILAIHGVPFIGSLLVGMALCALGGLLLGFPTLRLKGHYLALATLGMSEIIRLVALNWTSLTNGPIGITAIPRPAIFGFRFQSDFSVMLLYLAIAALVHFFLYRLIHSPYGKVLEAIREDEVAAQSLGKNVFRYKMQVLILGAVLAGMDGILYAHAFNFIDPTIFKIPDMVLLLTMIIVGGLGNFWGAIVGPTVMVALFEGLRFVHLPAGFVGPLRMMIYSTIFIAVIIFRPQGIIGRLKHFHRKFK